MARSPAIARTAGSWVGVVGTRSSSRSARRPSWARALLGSAIRPRGRGITGHGALDGASQSPSQAHRPRSKEVTLRPRPALRTAVAAGALSLTLPVTSAEAQSTATVASTSVQKKRLHVRAGKRVVVAGAVQPGAPGAIASLQVK